MLTLKDETVFGSHIHSVATHCALHHMGNQIHSLLLGSIQACWVGLQRQAPSCHVLQYEQRPLEVSDVVAEGSGSSLRESTKGLANYGTRPTTDGSV